MNTNTLKIAPNRIASRGAHTVGTWFANAGLALFKLFAKLPARRLTLAEEAAEVRAMADRVRKTEPGFAADLYAAAARHELLND